MRGRTCRSRNQLPPVLYPYVSTDIIAKLETQADSNIDLALAVAELAETSAADKLDVEMAIAELAEVMMNG